MRFSAGSTAVVNSGWLTVLMLTGKGMDTL